MRQAHGRATHGRAWRAPGAGATVGASAAARSGSGAAPGASRVAGDLVEVLVEVADLLILVLEVDPDKIPDRDHREEASLAHHRQVTDVRLIHLAHRRLVVLVGVCDDEGGGHNGPDRDRRGVESAVYHPLYHVALGENPHQPLAIEHAHNPYVVGRHHAHRLAHGGASLHHEEKPRAHDVPNSLHCCPPCAAAPP